MTSPETASSILKHPLRPRILAAINERPMSPVMIVKAGLAPGCSSTQAALSQVSYHCRALEKLGCAEVLEVRQRRGATEHIYGGELRGLLDRERNGVPSAKKVVSSRALFQGLAARVEVALFEKSLEARPDRELWWYTSELDERGWSETIAALEATRDRLREIRESAAQRLADIDREPISVTVGLLGFESPRMP